MRLTFALLLTATLAGCGGTEVLSIGCVHDSDCNDRIFCNGEETCQAMGGNTTACVRTPRDCSAMSSTCGPGYCDETLRECVSTMADVDGDGSVSDACCNALGCGDDCDDNDANRYPGNTEVCDAAGHDEDCDPTTFGFKDSDGDGYADASCCNGANCGNDCDDSNGAVHPNAPELCNGIDDNCNGAIDEGVTVALYVDADRDGYGAAGSTPLYLCTGAPGYSPLNNDCDDSNPSITPGAMICDASTPAVTSDVRICTQDGTWLNTGCSKGTATCVVQPNGLGVCI
jgi:hypothetical protein